MPNGAPEFRITFARSAAKELAALNPPVARRVLAAIERLALDPRPHGCLKLTGSDSDWRVRVGDWRVLYTINDRARPASRWRAPARAIARSRTAARTAAAPSPTAC